MRSLSLVCGAALGLTLFACNDLLGIDGNFKTRPDDSRGGEGGESDGGSLGRGGAASNFGGTGVSAGSGGAGGEAGGGGSTNGGHTSTSGGAANLGGNASTLGGTGGRLVNGDAGEFPGGAAGSAGAPAHGGSGGAEQGGAAGKSQGGNPNGGTAGMVQGGNPNGGTAGKSQGGNPNGGGGACGCDVLSAATCVNGRCQSLFAGWPMPNSSVADPGAPNPAAFVDNGNGTVTDSVTGLMWEKAPPNQTLLHDEAVARCESLMLGGHQDFRLPSKIELVSLVDYGYSPSINATYFPGTQRAFYWTATNYALAPTAEKRWWYLNFADGDLRNAGGSTAKYLSRCVR